VTRSAHPDDPDPLAPDHNRNRFRRRSRGTPPLASLPLRPASSGGDRGPRKDLVPLRGEVVERDVPVARPVERGDNYVYRPGLARQPQTVEVHHHYERPADPVPFVEESGVRWDRLGAYMFGIGMLLVVLLVLALAGVLDLHAVHPPWQAPAHSGR
jgi:hypothetical protein